MSSLIPIYSYNLPAATTWDNAFANKNKSKI